MMACQTSATSRNPYRQTKFTQTYHIHISFYDHEMFEGVDILFGTMETIEDLRFVVQDRFWYIQILGHIISIKCSSCKSYNIANMIMDCKHNTVAKHTID